jgi:DNA-binding response OmpR family regulator
MEGLNSLSSERVDVMLLDLGLPDSNGYETFTTARTLCSGRAHHCVERER